MSNPNNPFPGTPTHEYGVGLPASVVRIATGFDMETGGRIVAIDVASPGRPNLSLSFSMADAEILRQGIANALECVRIADAAKNN